MKVSVILPIHNSVPYLQFSLQSLQKQTLQDIEIICVENGSEDDSYQILKKEAQKDSRIKVFDIGKSTIGGARAFGLTKAKGEYIALIDHDDEYEENALEVLYNSVNGKDVAIGNFYIERNKHKKIYYKDDFFKSFEDLFFSKHGIFVWGKLFKRSFIEENNISFANLSLGDDTLFMNTVLLNTNFENIVILPKDYLYKKRFTGKNTARKLLKEKPQKIVSLFNALFPLIKNRLKKKEFNIKYLFFVYRHFIFGLESNFTRFGFFNYLNAVSKYLSHKELNIYKFSYQEYKDYDFKITPIEMYENKLWFRLKVLLRYFTWIVKIFFGGIKKFVCYNVPSFKFFERGN